MQVIVATMRAIVDFLLPQALVRRPLINRSLWLLFAIAFFQSGMAFTTLLLEPESFRGGLDWLWVILFPILLPAFFIVNRRLGCGAGRCTTRACIQTPSTPEMPNEDASPGVGPMTDARAIYQNKGARKPRVGEI